MILYCKDSLGFGYRMFTSRTLVITGAVLAFLGYFLNAYASNIILLILTQGLLVGKCSIFTT
jgi:hypothetical protein